MPTKEKGEMEPLVSRWSRRKLEAREQALQEAAVKPAEFKPKPMPELLPADKLNFESDFTGFMDVRVDDAVRRIALKKLFGDPRFNITDGLDDYAEDYSALEDLSAALVDKLEHARSTLRGPKPDDGKAVSETQTADQHIDQPVESEQEQEQEQEQQPPADAGSREEASDSQGDSDKMNERSG